MSRLADVVSATATVLRVTRRRDVKYPAAALAYYAFVSLLPLSLLLFVILGEQIASRIVELTPPFLTPEAHRLIYDGLTTATGRTGASLLAIAVLGWSSLNFVVAFTTALSRIDGDPRSWPLSRRVRDGGVVLGSIAVAVAAIVVVSALPALLPAEPVVRVIAPVLLVTALTAIFLPLYSVPSGTLSGPRAAIPGAAVAAIGWTVLQTFLQLYAATAGRYAIYGVLSGIILVLTSLYLAALALVVGAVVNETVAKPE